MTTLKNDSIKKYWDKQARKRGHLKNATVRDWYLRDLEVETTQKYLKKSDTVIDIGCGNGGPTLQLSSFVKHIVGVDFSEMLIQEAIKLSNKKRVKNIEFLCANALSLPFQNESFDKAIMSRVLINIPSQRLKNKAIREAIRILKKNGTFILLESTLQGHRFTDGVRKKFRLERLKKHWHNVYVDEKYMNNYLKRNFTIEDTHRFSMYMFISKILHPLIVYPEEPQFLSKINKVASEISKEILEIENLPIGHNLMWVLKKK